MKYHNKLFMLFPQQKWAWILHLLKPWKCKTVPKPKYILAVLKIQLKNINLFYIDFNYATVFSLKKKETGHKI